MKKIKLLSATLLLMAVIAQNVNAKIWRVNNKSNYNGTTLFGDNMGGTPTYPVFDQVNDVVGYPAINNFDTIHVEASPTVYAQADIDRPLVIIGSGYFIYDNPKTTNSPYNTKIARVEFDAGSQGSQLLGMDVVYAGNTVHGAVWITVNNVTVKRCRIENVIAFQTGLIDTYILQNYFDNANTATNAIGTNGNTAFVPPTDLIFNNNIVKNKLLWYNSNGQFPILECKNNVFDGPSNTLLLDFATSAFHDNIIKPTLVTTNINSGSNANVLNVTCTNATQFPGTPGLVVEPVMSNVFQTSVSKDGQYQLNPTWAAANPGANGERGCFGGPVTSHYSLSGLAAIPVIYDVTTNGVSVAGQGLPINVKARTIK